ncbi:hypothetical protein D3C71_1756770 [compost metagenome]
MLVDPLERIPRRNRQQPADRIVSQFSQQLVQIVTTEVRPCGIVNQYPILIISALRMQVQQGVEHRPGTFGAALDPGNTRITGTRQVRPIRIVHSNTDHQTFQAWMIKETAEAVFENSAPAQLQVLLGTVRGHTGTDARGRNHGPEGR